MGRLGEVGTGGPAWGPGICADVGSAIMGSAGGNGVVIGSLDGR